VTFLDTGAVSGDAPPRNVASITAMTRKARGDGPGLRLVSDTIGLLDDADCLALFCIKDWCCSNLQSTFVADDCLDSPFV